MDALDLARLQFAITSIYHFFFVPLTLGLAILVAIMETAYVRTGEAVYKQMTKFWGKLFLINFAMGVVTGIVMEFQFGMNWSEYSRFVGDIFGAPLAIEALMAFFLESTFIGIWIFGWDKISAGLHAVVMWLVALGASVSALWILIANSFMQQPVGFDEEAYYSAIAAGETGVRPQMNDFFELITNPNVFVQFPHVITSGMVTAAFFVLGISAFHLLRKSKNANLFRKSFQMAMVYGLVAGALVILIGHDQAQHMVETQPMKIAAAEALWDTEEEASLSLFTIGDEEDREDVFAIRLPSMLSILAYNTTDHPVQGINDLNEQYQEQFADIYGEDADYVPPVAISYWSFRIMVGAGFAMLGVIIYGLFLMFEDSFERRKRYLQLLVVFIAVPYLANMSGWILTEVGRYPWIVFGMQRVEDAVSPNLGVGSILFSLIVFTLVYGALAAVDVYLLSKFARQVPGEEEGKESEEDTEQKKTIGDKSLGDELQGAFSGD